jgi:TPR repeat protein
VLQLTETNRAIAAEQKVALASERDRADALTRELTSVRNELEAGNRQVAALNALGALHSRESAVDSSQERMAESSSRTIEGKGRSPEQLSGEAVAPASGRSSASEVPRPEAQSTARETASDLGVKVAMGTERSPSASAASRSFVEEQRLLARANALLRQGDIGGARLLLEHALERGSAQAAFMLAETYDARVLRSWRARGISGDFTKARELYERAQAGGIEDAKERIETLK